MSEKNLFLYFLKELVSNPYKLLSTRGLIIYSLAIHDGKFKSISDMAKFINSNRYSDVREQCLKQNIDFLRLNNNYLKTSLVGRNLNIEFVPKDENLDEIKKLLKEDN
jgi:hypothetical protein